MNNDFLYQLALTQIPKIGDARAKALLNEFGTAEAVFKASQKKLEHIENIGSLIAKNIKSFNDFSACEKEIQFIEKYKKVKPVIKTVK